MIILRIIINYGLAFDFEEAILPNQNAFLENMG